MTIIDKEKLKLFKESIQDWLANQNYKKKQTAVADPNASGNSISFIDTITQDADGKITPTKKTIPNSSQSSAGLMSKDDFTKLKNIASNANNYTLPTATSDSLGGIKVGDNLSISNGVLSATNTTYQDATTTKHGLMSAADKTKLDGIGKYVTDISTQQPDSGWIIPSGWTRYGDIVMKDTVTTNKSWYETSIMEETINLTKIDQKIVFTYSDGSTTEITLAQAQIYTYTATFLSKEILESLTAEQRKSPDGNWYWTSTVETGGTYRLVNSSGDFSAFFADVNYSDAYGGARLGFTL